MPSPVLHESVLAHGAATPAAPALATRTHRVTYGELAARIRALAGELVADGLRPGDHVLVALPNSIGGVVASLAVQMVGAVPAEVGRAPTDGTLDRALGTLPIVGAFVDARDAPRWGARLPDAGVRTVWLVGGEPARAAPTGGVAWRSIDDRGGIHQARATRTNGELRANRTAVDPDSIAVILFTSGSTGTPHAVAQTHRNIDANSRAIVTYLRLTPADRALLTLPLAYCYGRSVLQTHLLIGASVYLEDRSAFPAAVLRAIADEGCTGFAGVPLTFELMRRQVDPAALTFPRLRYLTQAGGAMAIDTTRWVRDAFRPAELFVMYGQTEATARLSYLPPDRAADKEGSIGIAIPGVELRVVDEAGRRLPPGEVGHLIARGESITRGYLDDPDATAEILRDGWLWTGDLASSDGDGFLFHHGRSKEIIKVNGHRLGLAEIEAAIERHPAVAEAAVVGVPDELAGELPVALVVRRPGSDVGDDELRAHGRSTLPPPAVPVRYVFVRSLPRNEAGKLLRPALAALLVSPRDEASLTG